MSIKVQDFHHIPGVNDAEYIKLLEHHLDLAHQTTSKALAKIRELSSRRDCELEQAFRLGMNYGYGIDHENIREEEDAAVAEFMQTVKGGNMTEHTRTLLQNHERYKTFTLLNKPVPFNKLFADKNYDCVQLHDITECGDDDVIGFCGGCIWKDNMLTPDDGDSYSDNMLVYGYSEFTQEEYGIKNGLDILVEEW